METVGKSNSMKCKGFFLWCFENKLLSVILKSSNFKFYCLVGIGKTKLEEIHGSRISFFFFPKMDKMEKLDFLFWLGWKIDMKKMCAKGNLILWKNPIYSECWIKMTIFGSNLKNGSINGVEGCFDESEEEVIAHVLCCFFASFTCHQLWYLSFTLALSSSDSDICFSILDSFIKAFNWVPLLEIFQLVFIDEFMLWKYHVK